MRPQVVAAGKADTVTILGHGLTISSPVELTKGVFVEPAVPDLKEDALGSGCATDHDRFAVQAMHDLATFSVRVFEPTGGKVLATKAWNALWCFHLLSVCCGSPTFILYSVSVGGTTEYAVANRNLVLNPLPNLAAVSASQLAWAKANYKRFDQLIKDQRFGSAMRYFGNSHYLFDLDARIMLLWAGIEGLLAVEAEQSWRIATYAALMFDGSAEEKAAHADRVRKAYHLRSKVIHGAKPSMDKLQEGYDTASEILVRLLAKCVCLGRVPTRVELHGLAASASLTV